MTEQESAPISHANVWPVGDELVVTWRGGGDVSVFVSDDPVDAGIDVRAPDGPNQAMVPRGQRTYVHLFDPEHGFTVVAERVLAMEGVRNFRDLGGYPIADGGATRWGRVFRSGRIDTASDADLHRMRELGITKVFDLRTDEEVELAPSRVPSDSEYVHLPMSSSAAEPKSFVDRVADGEIASYTRADKADGYQRMLDRFGDHLARVAEAVAEGDTVLVHCAAGKDRTGIAAMFLLGLAGVGDGHILDDYEISAQHQPGDAADRMRSRIVAAGADPEMFDLATVVGSPRPVMRMALDGLRDRWGDVAGYAEFVGVSRERQLAAAANLRFAQW